MKRCPRCDSEMIVIDTHCISVAYKIVEGRRSKRGAVEKPSQINKVSSKIVCPNCRYTENFNG